MFFALCVYLKDVVCVLFYIYAGPSSMINKYSCVCLHGDRRPQERKANLQAFKDGEVRFLICTDVAARGIDVRGIPFGMNVNVSMSLYV